MTFQLHRQAIDLRLRRLGTELGLSFIAAVGLDAWAGAFQPHQPMLVPLLAWSLVVYFWLRAGVRAGQADSFAWRRTRPWLLLYWPVALALVLLGFLLR